MHYDFKNGCKINFRIITNNHAADSKIRSLKKSILEPIGPDSLGVKNDLKK